MRKPDLTSGSKVVTLPAGDRAVLQSPPQSESLPQELESPADADEEFDEEIDYISPPPKRRSIVPVRFVFHGKAKALPYPIEELVEIDYVSPPQKQTIKVKVRWLPPVRGKALPYPR